MICKEGMCLLCVLYGYWVVSRGFLPRKCVYGTRPVSAHPLGAVQCLMLVHVGSQD